MLEKCGFLSLAVLQTKKLVFSGVDAVVTVEESSDFRLGYRLRTCSISESSINLLAVPETSPQRNRESIRELGANRWRFIG